jgi:asparagine synthase (glutamine-hydrolysing)
MPGLIGFVKDIGSDRAQASISRMADALESDRRFRRHLYHDDMCGLGRVSLDIINPEPQPVWNEDHNVCLVMEGEFYNRQDLLPELQARGCALKSNSDPELALSLYQEFGEEFALCLNGAFAVAIWDTRDQKLLVTNDRLGLFPIYYARSGDGLVFGSGVRALLADPDLSRAVDPAAIAQFLTFDHALRDRTLLKAAKLLDQASVLTFQDARLRIRPYWKLKYTDIYPLLSLEEYLEELTRLMRQSISRQTYDDLSAGLLLSGGLDSRWLLGLLAETPSAGKLHTFTWGIPGCDDGRFAKDLAKIAGVQHHFFKLREDWLLSKAENAVRITDGLGNIVNLHALATLEEESQFASVIYKGFLGDAMFGYALVPRFWADYEEDVGIQAHWQTHRDHGVIFFDLDEQRSLFSERFQQSLGGAVLEDYEAGMKEASSSQLANQRLFFDLRQRVPRMTIRGVEVVRDRAVVRLPFCDNDLVDFTTQVPPGYLDKRFLITEAFIRTYPQLAKVPATPANLPLLTCARDIYLRGWHLVQWHMRKTGLGRFAGPQKRPYRDYNTWFRTVLRSWVEDILLGPRSLQRGYYNPQYLRNLVAEHMAGANHAVKLGALTSIELWHRMYLD